MRDTLEGIVDTRALNERLEASAKDHDYGVALICHHRGKRHQAQANGFTTRRPVQTGCVAKSLTATLVGVARSQGRLLLEDSVATHLPGRPFSADLRRHLKVTSIYHLLNHTGGFDQASEPGTLPVDHEGHIHLEALATTLDALAPAGEVFHYNSLGPWLAAAILEELYERPYGDVLQSELLTPLEIPASATQGPNPVCPSVGGGLQLSCEDLLKIALLHLYEHERFEGLLGILVDMRSRHVRPLPPWPQMGKRITPCWIDFGGSFGQLGYGEESAGVIRLLPDQEAAIVVTAGHQGLANASLATVFKEVLEDFDSKPPAMLSTGEWAETDREPYQGQFENGKYRLVIDTAANGCLRARVYHRQGEAADPQGEAFIKRYFRAAPDHTFLPLQPERRVCPVLQFSGSMADGRFQYINTRRYLFSRTAEATSRQVAAANA